MATRIYLTSLDSDVSGYKLALVGRRNPASTALATAVTNITAGQAAATEDAMTATAGGTAIKWITKPFYADVTINSQMMCNFWAKESNLDANVAIACDLCEYTTSEQTKFLDDAVASGEVTASAALYRFITTAASSTTIDAGNRLVIKPLSRATDTTGTARTLTFDYDGPTNDADGDSYVELPEDIRVNETQTGSGGVARVPGLGQGMMDDWIDRTNALIGVNVISGSQSVQSAIDEVGYERDLN